MIEDRRSPAEKIPVEIISKILEHLSISDRKNARLVNYKWYQAGRAFEFQKCQKFVIDGTTYQNHLSSIFEALKNGCCNYYNLEFHNMDFNSDLSKFVTFMKSNPLCIYSLSFIRCSFPFAMIEEIMINCLNLEEMCFKKCSCMGFEKAILILNSSEKIVRRSFRFLEINLCDWFTNHVFEIFINVYPNMSKVRFAYYSGFNEFTVNFDNRLENSKPLFLNGSIGECFHDEFFAKLTSHPSIKMEELRIYDPYYHYHVHEFEPFLLSQKELKIFDSSWCENFDTESLELLINRCPNLECLKYSLFWRRDEASMKKVLELVANSKLKVVTICRFELAREGAEFQKFNRNENINYLDIQSSQLCETCLITILKTFCNLTYLDLSHTKITGERKHVRKIIFQNQIQLRYLKLNCCNWICNHAIKKCKLTKLEHLELTNSRITGAAFCQFNFPELKFLCLKGCGAIADEDFTILPSICSLLKHLNVGSTKISEKTILKVCENLKFLHCLNVVGKKRLPIKNINIISQHCPSLRFIQVGNFNKKYGITIGSAYHYNILSKEWIKSHVSGKQCIHCEPSERRLMENCTCTPNLR